jgi:hypothetical protein
MFGELQQPPPGFPGTNVANPVAAEDADYAAMQAYVDMTAAMARYAQLLTASRQQHAGPMRFGARQQPSSLSPSPKLPAAKRAPFGSSLRMLVLWVLIGAAGGFYARGQLLPQQRQPSQQLSRK